MATVSRGLPEQPHLDVPKREARELLDRCRAAHPEALERIRRRVDRFRSAPDDAWIGTEVKLADAQLAIAREYGFPHWTALKQRIAAREPADRLRELIHAGERDAVVHLLREHPDLLHVPLWSGTWGPPMSHAANLGHLDIVQAIAALGARDTQHALGRAILQGQVETARWLLGQGAPLAPGIALGPCESLDPAGLRLLIELHAPLADAAGNRLAPLALVLETYARHPDHKHEVLEILAGQGYDLPDTPIVALHRGQVDRLEAHLRRDPALIQRRFPLTEIYPAELGCARDGRGGMHGTPLGGGTLLHLAIDFDEQEIFEFLLSRGADVDARAAVDADGFGGHTPLFHALVGSVISCGRRRDAAMAEKLLARGANTALRADLRKFLDWVETPRWHTARDVTALAWARSFPLPDWINHEACRIVSESCPSLPK